MNNTLIEVTKKSLRNHYDPQENLIFPKVACLSLRGKERNSLLFHDYSVQQQIPLKGLGHEMNNIF